MSKAAAAIVNAIKDLTKSREIIFAFIIGLLMCYAWDLPYIWAVIYGLPLIGLFYGIKHCEARVESNKNVASKFQIGMLCLMVIVVMLSIYERYKIEPSLQEARRILGNQMLEECMRSCEEFYGFRFLLPSTWHLYKNKPLDACYDRCRERARK